MTTVTFKVQLISELHFYHHPGSGREGLVLPPSSTGACLRDTADGRCISTIVATGTTKGLVEHFLSEEVDSIECSHLVDYLTESAVLICLGGEVYNIFHGEKFCLFFLFLKHLYLQRNWVCKIYLQTSAGYLYYLEYRN